MPTRLTLTFAALFLAASVAAQEDAQPEQTADGGLVNAVQTSDKDARVLLLQDMVKKGLDPNSKVRDKYDILLMAAGLGLSEFTDMLLERGADIAAADKDGDTALHLAVARGPEILGVLLRHGADVNAVGKDGVTALHRAANLEDLETVRFLLDNGADINAVANDRGTPLTYAVHGEKWDNAALLLERGANVNVKADGGMTAASLLLLHIHDNPFNDLRGAPPPEGTATEAMLKKCEGWGGQLDPSFHGELPGDAEINSTGSKCNDRCAASHLHYAADLYDLEAIRWLTANGADVHSKDGCSGGTPLHWAAGTSDNNHPLGWAPENRRKAFQLLIDAGADANAKAEDDDTPADWVTTDNADESIGVILKELGGHCNTTC